MVRVKVRSHLSPLAFAALSLSTLGALEGCAAETEDDLSEDLEQGLTTAPGTGAIHFQGFSLAYQSTSGGDEIVRTGERLVTDLSFDDLTYLFDYADRASLTPANVSVSAKITWLDRAGATKSTSNVPVAWGTGANARVGKTASFTVPKATFGFTVDYKVTHAGKSFFVSEKVPFAKVFPIFGAALPSKLAAFDNGPDGARRTRIIEGGNLVAGAPAQLSVVDWRADAVVDRSRLDARYGRRTAFGRFGPVVVDAIGTIEYEVGVAYTVDGTNWTGTNLAAVADPRVLATLGDSRRTAYEGSVNLPKGTKELRLAFHVRAFLVVPSFGSEVFDARYAPGSRVLLADAWDNAGGADFRLPVAAR